MGLRSLFGQDGLAVRWRGGTASGRGHVARGEVGQGVVVGPGRAIRGQLTGQVAAKRHGTSGAGVRHELRRRGEERGARD